MYNFVGKKGLWGCLADSTIKRGCRIGFIGKKFLELKFLMMSMKKDLVDP